MLDWKKIDTVFLDMDGTLLDLHFDNYFWLEHVPLRYGEKHGLNPGDARDALLSKYRSVEGTLQWYCIDYWSVELDLDITALKNEVSHKIAVQPHAERFLASVRESGRSLILLTNAHGRSVELKLRKTELGQYFDRLIISHDLGEPKESDAFWQLLRNYQPFKPERALLVDDNLSVLRAAAGSGIAWTIAVKRPDTTLVEKDTGEFPAIADFSEILPD